MTDPTALIERLRDAATVALNHSILTAAADAIEAERKRAERAEADLAAAREELEVLRERDIEANDKLVKMEREVERLQRALADNGKIAAHRALEATDAAE